MPKLLINIPERKDRLEQAKKELIDLPYYLIGGVVYDNSMIGIAISHLKALKFADSNLWSFVCIMEDDIKFRPGFAEYLNEALQNLPEDWDILLGGIYGGRPDKKVNNYWSQIGEFCGLHFYIVNMKCYDKLMQYDNTQHIDRWIGLKGDNIKCFVTNKYFALQHDGYSDNVKEVTKYNDKINKSLLL